MGVRMRQPPHAPVQVQKLQAGAGDGETEHQQLEKQVVVDWGVRKGEVLGRGGLLQALEAVG